MMTDQRNRWLTAMLLLVFWTVTYRHVAAQAPAATEEAQAPTREPDVIYVPTPQPVVDKMLELAEVKKGDVVYDLGCGDGRIVVTAAKKYGVKAVGFDINPERIKEGGKTSKRTTWRSSSRSSKRIFSRLTCAKPPW